MDSFLHDLDWVLPLRNELLTAVFKTLTSLGDSAVILIILVMVFWIGNRHAGNRLAIIVLATILLNWFLKDLWQNPRPDAKFVLDRGSTTSFGAPSGHTQIAVVMWLWIACEVGKRWVWFVAVTIAAGISFSRLYLGKHDLEDVLAGLAIGLGTLLFFRWMLSPRFNWWRTLSPLVQLGVTATGLAALYYFWPVEPVKGLIVIIAGFLIGWLTGVSILNWKHFEFKRITLGRTASAGLIAIAILGAILLGLRSILEAPLFPETVARLLGGVIAGAVTTGLVPFLLVRFKLMERVESAAG